MREIREKCLKRGKRGKESFQQEIPIGDLAKGNGCVIDHSNEADISKDFLVVTDYKMSDYGPDHGSDQETS